MRTITLALLGFVLNAHAAIYIIPYHNTLFDMKCCLNIAHAGGSIQGHAYTNSKEALDANYALGRRVFEIDFDKTKDKQWVLTHGWKQWANQVGQSKPITRFEKLTSCLEEKPPKPFHPTQAEFLSERLFQRFTPMTLSDLAAWLTAHPDATIIVDTWKDYLSELFDAVRAHPNMMHHLVFQTYHPEDILFLKSKNIPTSRMIFSNYQALLSNQQMVELIQREHVGALTIDLHKAYSDLLSLRKELPRTPIYIHGKPESINSLEAQYQATKMGASGFYLD